MTTQCPIDVYTYLYLITVIIGSLIKDLPTGLFHNNDVSRNNGECINGFSIPQTRNQLYFLRSNLYLTKNVLIAIKIFLRYFSFSVFSV